MKDGQLPDLWISPNPASSLPDPSAGGRGRMSQLGSGMNLTPHQIFVGVITALVIAVMIPVMIFIVTTMIHIYG